MEYGEKLKELREYNDLTQNDIAKLLDISRSSYNQFEQQYDIIPIKRLNEVANIFNVSMDYIFSFTNIKQYNNSNKEIDIGKSSQRLKEIRKENKLTQEKLASILNTVHSVITKCENSSQLISTSFLYDICKKYNISADYLLGRIDNPKYF